MPVAQTLPNVRNEGRPKAAPTILNQTFARGRPRGFFGGLSSAFSRISAATSAPLVSGFFFGLA